MAGPSTISRRGLLVGAGAVAVGGALASRWWQDSSGSQLRAADFGAVGDGVADDGPALRRALATARNAGPGATLQLGAGRYRVGGTPGAGYALPVAGARGLSIAGDPATIVVADPALGCLSLSDCDDCRVTGVVIDYDPPPFAQTTVTRLDPGGRTFDVEVAPGYPLLDAPLFSFPAPDVVHPGAFGAAFDPATRRLKPGMVDFVFVTAAEPTGPRTFRLTPRDGVPAGLAPADAFVYVTRQGGNAVASYRSSGTRIDRVVVRAANSIAFALVQSDAARVTRCTVGLEPGSGRLVSTNADGVHAQGCRIGPTVEDCAFAAMMDDGLNVYALPLEIVSAPSDLEALLSGVAPVRAGDQLEFTEPTSGDVLGVRRVERVLGAGSPLRVRLTDPLPGLAAAARAGTPVTAFDLSASGEGYLIRDNTYDHHRGHAMRLHTGRGTVQGNRIRATSREGIQVSNDPDWPEGPNTRDLLLRDNTLAETGGDAAVAIEGRRLGYQLAKTATQRRITLEGTRVTDWRGSAITIGAAHDVTVSDTTLVVDGGAEPAAAQSGVLVETAYRVEIDGLEVRTTPADALGAAVVIAPTVLPGETGVRISDVRVPAGLAAVEDLRADTSIASAGGPDRRVHDARELARRVGPVPVAPR